MASLVQGIRAAAVMALLFAIALVGQPATAQAQASVDLTAVNALGLSTADQTSLSTALQAVADAIAGGNQAAITAAQSQLASAVTQAVTDNPNAAAQIAGAATAAVPGAALTIAQSAAAANPAAAAGIAVAVFTALPADLQSSANKTLIASTIAAVPGVDATVMTAALANQTTVNNNSTVTLQPTNPQPVSPG